MAIVYGIIFACLFAEFVGYFLHILLHSEKIPYLSKNHMLHHLRDYGPKSGMRRPQYLSSAEGRSNILGFGLEWMGPVLGITAAVWILFFMFDLTWAFRISFTVTAFAWGYLMFGYMHDAMHLENFWMLKFPWTRRWFLNVRKLHDIHHLELTNDGRMTTNYGICFFFMDRIFGSLLQKMQSFNEKGYEAAKQRYSYAFNEEK